MKQEDLVGYEALVDRILEQIRVSPPDLLGLEEKFPGGEYRYCLSHRASYVRTLRDVSHRLAANSRVLELGAFTGVVSLALKDIGHRVIASDIPEFFENEHVAGYYERHGIDVLPLNLRTKRLPFDDGSLDAVCMCETLEHLNFNPLPLLLEINRILKNDGVLYVAMPNFGRIGNRVKAILGRSVHNPISDYLAQLSRNGNLIVGLHWREYTMAETLWMLETMGFTVADSRYFSENNRSIVHRIANLVPALRQSLVVSSRKSFKPAHDFWITEANS